MLLKAYKPFITYQQYFSCKMEYNKRKKQLRKMGFTFSDELVH